MGSCTQTPRSPTPLCLGLHWRARYELPVPVSVGAPSFPGRMHTVPRSRGHAEVGRVSGRS